MNGALVPYIVQIDLVTFDAWDLAWPMYRNYMLKEVVEKWEFASRPFSLYQWKT